MVRDFCNEAMKNQVQELKNQQQTQNAQKAYPLSVDDDAIAQQQENHQKTHQTDGYDAILDIGLAFFCFLFFCQGDVLLSHGFFKAQGLYLGNFILAEKAVFCLNQNSLVHISTIYIVFFYVVIGNELARFNDSWVKAPFWEIFKAFLE